MVRLLRYIPLAAVLLAGTVSWTSFSARSPDEKTGISSVAVTPRPWPAVVSRHKRQARVVLEDFSRAVDQNRVVGGKRIRAGGRTDGNDLGIGCVTLLSV